MYPRFLSFSCSIILLIFTCNACRKKAKEPEVPPIPQIDVATQWHIDIDGYPLFIPDSGQWSEKTFTHAENQLFAPFDTASLAGTIMPDSFQKVNNYPYPNPFRNIHILQFKFNSSYTGEVVLKYVLVNAYQKVMHTMCTRLKAATLKAAVKPDLPLGKYRLYYTFSAEGHPDFYKSWGNIETYE